MSVSGKLPCPLWVGKSHSGPTIKISFYGCFRKYNGHFIPALIYLSHSTLNAELNHIKAILKT